MFKKVPSAFKHVAIVLAAAIVLVAFLDISSAARKQKTTRKGRPVAKPVQKIEWPRAVDDTCLGFGSTPADVARLLGRPTRVVKSKRGATWFYDLSSVTLVDGKLAGWTKYDHPLPMNIGAAVPGAPKVVIGISVVKDLVAAGGTPDSVVVSGQYQVWFYGTTSYTLRYGKLVPNAIPAAPHKPTAEKGQSERPARAGRCPCPL
jgi:hypothetical protein